MNAARIFPARRLGRVLLLVASLLTVFVVALLVGAPSCFSCHEDAGSGIMAAARFMPAVGVAGMLIGLGWMWRIYRAPAEFEEPRWRYRDR